MEFAQSLDPSKLLLVSTGLSFALALFESPSYNLPVLLFGSYAQENTESAQPLQTFTGLLGASVLFDLIWMAKHDQPGIVRLLTVVLFLLKIPTVLAVASALRQRGSQFGGLGLRPNDLSGPTIWSMPGGFTSEGRSEYQPVDEERPSQPPPVRPLPTTSMPMPQPVQPTIPVPGGYQTG
ncbi:hypothetical protein BDN72DRAFT_830260 [Pluteus cervinus]|uniref:Uncharacterized protein n=1 Tax=Pluteus cervinus TaxID=181527 RepID=A0ACD3BGX9_9AGAR|nr:hypothetical protein BDN72DRAFT_830260 [Pluteus cervinus]